MKKLAVVVTHPIQYYVPVFREISKKNGIQLKVFYTWGRDSINKFDPGFGKKVKWDIPLLEGYDYRFLENTAKDPGSHHYGGIQNPTIIAELESWKPDAILVIGWSYHSHLKVMRHFKGKIPVLFRGDSHLLNETGGIKSIVRRLFLTWVYGHIDIACCVGTNNKNYYQRMGIRDDQLVVAPHAVDNSFFEDKTGKQRIEADRLREEMNIGENEIAFLYAGKFESVKNLSLLIGAFRLAMPVCSHLVLVGNGPLEGELKQQAEGIRNIHFMNFQNQSLMPVVYRIGDVFCLPSFSETWGLVVNEAMACGLPVMVSDRVGCAVDLVKPGENGFIFSSTQVDELVEIMKQFDSREKIKLMGQKSLNMISEFTIERQAELICGTILKESND